MRGFGLIAYTVCTAVAWRLPLVFRVPHAEVARVAGIRRVP
jgi:hypothetical protein